MDIGLKLREERIKRGLSLRGLSLRCKSVAHTTIMRIEEGLSDPTLSTLKEISDALKIDLIKLISSNTHIEESLTPKMQEAINLVKQFDEKNLTTVISMLQSAKAMQEEYKQSENK